MVLPFHYDVTIVLMYNVCQQRFVSYFEVHYHKSAFIPTRKMTKPPHGRINENVLLQNIVIMLKYL